MATTVQSYLVTPALLLAAFGGGYATSLATQGATAQAAIVESAAYTFAGEVLPAANKTAVESGNGPVAAAVAHANGHLGLTGGEALVLTAGQCPLQAVNLSCYVTDAGVRQYKWEYRTKDLTRSTVFTAPQ